MKRANENFNKAVDSHGNVFTIEEHLEIARLHSLESEVVWSALCYREACPAWSLEKVMIEARRDWDI
jgi:hypothetical protein